LENTFQIFWEKHIVFGKTMELYDPLSMKFEVELGKKDGNLVFFGVGVLISYVSFEMVSLAKKGGFELAL